jgi:hypothetical protein
MTGVCENVVDDTPAGAGRIGTAPIAHSSPDEVHDIVTLAAPGSVLPAPVICPGWVAL